MDDNTSIQFRLRLAQINGININEAKDHVSTEIDYIGDASDRKKDAETHGVKITPSRKKVQDSDHSVSGPRENVRKFLTHHYGGDKDEAKENHPEVFKGMNEEKIDEARIDPREERRNATSKIITHMLKDENKDVRIAAISHPGATPEHITHALKDKVMAVRIVAIKHPKATPEHITQALKDGDRYVRQAALKHHNVTSEHITQAVKDPNPDVRRNAITHHLATPEHLEQGMKDPDGSVRRAASIIHERDHDPITDAARPQHLGDKD